MPGALMAQRLRRAVVIVSAVLLTAVPLLAHDFWLEPSSFRPRTGTAVSVRLLVGAHMLGDALARDPGQIELFIAAGPEGVTTVPGTYGGDPAGEVTVGKPGITVVGYQSRHATTELTADAFTSYLADEGLERVAAIRGTRTRADGRVREIFSRCAKALLLSGAPSTVDGDRLLGFKLELLSERNPYAMHAGDDMPFRLFHEGRPLEGALVVAMNSADPAESVRERSDRDGRVSLRLRRHGVWLVKTVHMIPATPSSGADWESFWASLTFELPRASAARGTAKNRR